MNRKAAYPKASAHQRTIALHSFVARLAKIRKLGLFGRRHSYINVRMRVVVEF